MLRPTRSRTTAAAVWFAVAALLLPGGAGAQTAPAPPSPVAVEVPAGTVAVVRRADGSVYSAITEAQHARFFGAAVSMSQQRPFAKAVPLVPPAFDACVNGKRWFEGGGRPRTKKARLRRCAAAHHEAQDTAVQQLLSLTWIMAEAERRGIVFTERRYARERRTIIDGQFGDAKGYRRWLRETTLIEADVRLNILSQLGQAAIIRQIYDSVPKFKDPARQLEAEQVSIEEFRTEFLLRGRASTTCSASYAALPACTGQSDADAPESGAEQPDLRW